MNTTKLLDKRDDGYVPYDMGVGGGDYFKLKWCLDCGQIQGAFPLPQTELEGAAELEEEAPELEDAEEDA